MRSQSVTASKSWLRWLIAVLAVSAFARIATLLAHNPLITWDSADYLRLAHQLGRLDLSGDIGQRVPLYPFFMLLLRYNLHLIQLVQALLGLAITAAIFYMIATLSRRPAFAAVGAALYGLNLAQIRIESTMLSETLTTFLVTLVGVAIVWLWSDRTRAVTLKLVVMAVCAGLLPLARPAYAFVPFVVFAVAYLWVPRSASRLLLLALIVFMPMLAWSTFNLTRGDSFGLSTGLGLNLTNKTGGYIEDAPQRYAVIRDLYMHARAEDKGDVVNTIWRHYRSMMAVTGQTFNELSSSFLHMNMWLIAAHPREYATNVAASYFDFFRFSGDGPLTLLALPRVTNVAWQVEAVLNDLIGAVFLLLVAAWVVRAISRRTPRPITPLFWLSLIVLVTDAVCAVIEFGDSARFGMPTQPLMFTVVVVTTAGVVDRILNARRVGLGHHPAATPGDM
jgi:hypothetical protein